MFPLKTDKKQILKIMLKHLSSSLAEFPMTSDGIYKKKIASFPSVSQYANKSSLTFNHSLEKEIITFHFSLCQRKQWQPIPVFLPGNSHGGRSLVGCSPWGREELEMTEWLYFHASEKEMATHSSVLAWRIPGTGEPGGLPSMGSHSWTWLKQLNRSSHPFLLL